MSKLTGPNECYNAMMYLKRHAGMSTKSDPRPKTSKGFWVSCPNYSHGGGGIGWNKSGRRHG